MIIVSTWWAQCAVWYLVQARGVGEGKCERVRHERQLHEGQHHRHASIAHECCALGEQNEVTRLQQRTQREGIVLVVAQEQEDGQKEAAQQLVQHELPERPT